MCSHRFDIAAYHSNQYYIHPERAFEIAFAVGVYCPASIHAYLLYRLNVTKTIETHVMLFQEKTGQKKQHKKQRKTQRDQRLRVPLILSPVMSYADGPGPSVSNLVICLCFCPNVNEGADGLVETTTFL